MPPEHDVAAIAIGAVRHARLRPVRHAFRYRAYFLRLPMRRLDAALAGQRFVSRNRFNVLAFHDADHGPKGGSRDLVAWVDGLLADAGIADATGALWLHTFPRVLGYAFKPVSFWFCHRADGALRAIVCEINNTFGERHCYLLAHRDGRPLAAGASLTATKAFHVSPFCPVAGGYRFRFITAGDRTIARVDYDDADGPLLETSLSGTLHPLCAKTVLSAFARSPLFSLGVVARIHWQALRLWIKRTPFFSKPAPPVLDVTR